MGVRRVMGTEIEYGITVVGQPTVNPMLASSWVVNAWASHEQRSRRAAWDFEEETPLRDARGFDLSRDVADRSLLTDEETGLANVILTNGARLYVDHAHPEYSTPEVLRPRDVVRWEKAGDRLMAHAARLAADAAGATVLLHKNNTDNKGVSYGAHENYLMARSTPFARIVDQLTGFFVTRQVFAGSGRVGRGVAGQHEGFQISQRADFFEVPVGLETTMKRPIINTRDEPHADPERFRRLHVIIGDANLSEVAILLKTGTTALVLDMIEAGTLGVDLVPAEPIRALHAVSHDPGLRTTVELRDGRHLTALQIQSEYLAAAVRHVEERQGHDVDPDTAEVLQRWESVLDRLGRDPASCAGEVDWIAKQHLVEQYRSRDGLGWTDPKLQLVDLQYADLRPEKSLHARLVAAGRSERLVTDDEVAAAVTEPPTDTRAYFRGRCLSRYPDAVAQASWDSVVFDLPGRPSLQRVPTMDPLRGTRDHVGDLLDRHPDAAGLLDEIAR